MVSQIRTSLNKLNDLISLKDLWYIRIFVKATMGSTTLKDAWYIYLSYDSSRKRCFAFKYIKMKLTLLAITLKNIAGRAMHRDHNMPLLILRLQRGLLQYEMCDTPILFSEAVKNKINLYIWGPFDKETSYHLSIQRIWQSKIVTIGISLVV